MLLTSSFLSLLHLTRPSTVKEPAKMERALVPTVPLATRKTNPRGKPTQDPGVSCKTFTPPILGCPPLKTFLNMTHNLPMWIIGGNKDSCNTHCKRTHFRKPYREEAHLLEPENSSGVLDMWSWAHIRARCLCYAGLCSGNPVACPVNGHRRKPRVLKSIQSISGLMLAIFRGHLAREQGNSPLEKKNCFGGRD